MHFREKKPLKVFIAFKLFFLQNACLTKYVHKVTTQCNKLVNSDYRM